jgi:hypothetical protein
MEELRLVALTGIEWVKCRSDAVRPRISCSFSVQIRLAGCPSVFAPTGWCDRGVTSGRATAHPLAGFSPQAPCAFYRRQPMPFRTLSNVARSHRTTHASTSTYTPGPTRRTFNGLTSRPDYDRAPSDASVGTNPPHGQCGLQKRSGVGGGSKLRTALRQRQPGFSRNWCHPAMALPHGVVAAQRERVSERVVPTESAENSAITACAGIGVGFRHDDPCGGAAHSHWG